MGAVFRLFVTGVLAGFAALLLSGCREAKAVRDSTSSIRLERAEVDSPDLKALMRLITCKYKVSAVPGQMYTLRLWAERYYKGNNEPDIVELPVVSSEFDESTILFNLPLYEEGEMVFVTRGKGSTGSTDRRLGPLIPGGSNGASYRFSTPLELRPGEKGILGLAWRSSGRYSDRSLEEMIQDNDVSVVFYISFTPGEI